MSFTIENLGIGERSKQYSSFQGDEKQMKHSVTISVNENEVKKNIVKANEMCMREKILSALFGKKAKVLVITPYDTVSEINIAEKGANSNVTKRSLSFDCR